MDFDIDICRAVGVPSREDGTPNVLRIDDESFKHPRWGQGLREVLDAVGERSRRAQGLGKAVTYGRGMVFGSCRVYLLAHRKAAFGLLKVGPKRLYVAKGAEEGLAEINPLCVLDFYVVEGHQRGGMGASLFRAMLSREGLRAEKFAYDRPSPKLIGFLRKHFGLAKYQAQSNNFVVFDAYFSPATNGPPSALKHRSSAGSGASANGSAVGSAAPGSRVGGPGGMAGQRSPSAPITIGPRWQHTPDAGATSEEVGILGTPQPHDVAGAVAEALRAASGTEAPRAVSNLDARGVPMLGKSASLPPPAPMPTPQKMLLGPSALRPPPGRGSCVKGHPPGLPDARRRCAPGATGGEPLRGARRTARSASPLTQAARSSLAPSPLVQAMSRGLRI